MALLSILKMRLWKLSFKDYHWKSGIKRWTLALRITGSNVALLPPCLPKKWAGRPTTNKHRVLQRVKISFEKSWAISFSFHADAFPRRSPLNTLSRNQQMLLRKWEYPNYERQPHRLNEMVRGNIGELTHKAINSKKKIGMGRSRTTWKVNLKNLLLHSTMSPTNLR